MLLDKARERAARAAPLTQPAAFGGVEGFDPGQPTEWADYLATSNDFFAAANLRAKTLAKLPWIKRDPGGIVVHDAPILDLLRRPNKHYTANRLKRVTELAMCVWGQYFWVLERGLSGLGQPREIWPVKPELMQVIPHPTEFVAGFKLSPPDGSAAIFFDSSEVVWFIQPDPSNPYQPLSPLAAARLAADTASGMMKANRNLFDQGMLGGGFVFPPGDQQMFETEQAKDLEHELDKRFRGVSKAHRWAVMTRQFRTESMSVTPKDAQFVDGLNLTFRHVCRALGVPPPLVGDAEFATLANLQVYERALYEHTIEDEVDFISSEISRQLGPSFGNSVVSMDLSDVVALQDDAASKWTREQGQLEIGAITINEWRESQGRDPVEWGAEPWFPRLVRQPGDEDPLGASEPERGARAVTRDQQRFTDDLIRLFDQQGAEFLRVIAKGGKIDDVDQDKWEKRFESTAAPHMQKIMNDSYDSAYAELFDLRAMPGSKLKATIQAGRMATQVNDRTYLLMRRALREAVESGADPAQAMQGVIDWAKNSRARTIAEHQELYSRTEGRLEGWRHAIRDGATEIDKQWITVQDNEVRDTHQRAHGQTVRIDQDFRVGAGSGPGPGQIGVAAEDINCRCVIQPVRRDRASNGHQKITEHEMRTLARALENA